MPGVPLLQVKNLHQSQASRGPRRSQRPTVLQDVSFSVEAGERVAVVGPPGSGKTALVRAVALIDIPEAGGVYWEGEDITRARGGRLRALRRKLQFVGGDPRRTLSPRLSVEDILAEPLLVHRLGSASERRARVEAAATAWGLNALLLGCKVSALSAAMCQRVALARALILQPRLLVCDGLADRIEPAAARLLLESLARACRSAGFAWLWTTSDRVLAEAFADRVLVMEDGRLGRG